MTADESENEAPRTSGGWRKFGAGVALYFFAAVLALVGLILVAGAQIYAVILMFAAVGIAAWAHRDLKRARSSELTR